MQSKFKFIENINLSEVPPEPLASADIKRLPVNKIYQTESAMADDILKVVYSYSDNISLVATIGILEHIKSIIQKNNGVS